MITHSSPTSFARGRDVLGVGRGDVRLGHRVGGADLAGEQRLQPLLLLRLGADALQHLHVAGVGRRAVHGLRRERILAELDRDIGVVEILQALAGLVVGQEEVPQAYFLGLVLGLLQHRELFRRKAPAIGLVLAEPYELDRHRVDGLADELLDVLVERTDLVRHAQIVEFFARIEVVGRRSRDIGVFHGLFPPICARTSILRARTRLVGRQCRRAGRACTSTGERGAIFRLMGSALWALGEAARKRRPNIAPLTSHSSRRRCAPQDEVTTRATTFRSRRYSPGLLLERTEHRERQRR